MKFSRLRKLRTQACRRKVLACQAMKNEENRGISWDKLIVLTASEPIQADGAAICAP